MPPEAPARAREALARKPDWITFTSSSTVKNLIAALGANVATDLQNVGSDGAPAPSKSMASESVKYDAGREALQQFQRSGGKLASIGPITSQTLRSFGLTPDAEADPHTIEGLVEAIASHQQ